MTTPIDGPLEGPTLAEFTVPRHVSAPITADSKDVASTEIHKGEVDDFVRVVHIPDLETFGVCRMENWSPEPGGPCSYVIALREWNPQVLLHEILHVIVDRVLGSYTYDGRANPQIHPVINAVEVGLFPHLALLAQDSPPMIG